MITTILQLTGVQIVTLVRSAGLSNKLSVLPLSDL